MNCQVFQRAFRGLRETQTNRKFSHLHLIICSINPLLISNFDANRIYIFIVVICFVESLLFSN